METSSADFSIVARRWVQGMKRRAALILIVSIAAFSASAVFIMKIPNVYHTETRILVNPQRVSDKYVSSAVSTSATERLNTLSQQVLSASRLEVILDDFHLFPNLRNKVSRQELIAMMRKNIGIELKQSADGPSSFTLSYEGETPNEVAAVTNRLAESFISWNLNDRAQEAQGTTEFLNSALIESKERLDKLEQQLSAYKMSHLGELPDQQPANLETLSRLEVQLQGNTEARSHLDNESLLASLEPTYRQFTESGGVDPNHGRSAPSRLTAAKSELRQLEERYTQNHPDVIAQKQLVAQLEREVSSDPENKAAANPAPNVQRSSGVEESPRTRVLAQERNRLLGAQRDIEAQIRTVQAHVDAAPVREQEMSQLLRDYETARQHYASLLEKNYSAQMAAELERRQQGGSFTLLDVARVPDAPIRPQRGALLIGALLGSLALGMGLAILLEHNDATIKCEEDLHRMLPHVPILGLTPHLSRSRFAAGQVTVLSPRGMSHVS